jgi:hypothetical protein
MIEIAAKAMPSRADAGNKEVFVINCALKTVSRIDKLDLYDYRRIRIGNRELRLRLTRWGSFIESERRGRVSNRRDTSGAERPGPSGRR